MSECKPSSRYCGRRPTPPRSPPSSGWCARARTAPSTASTSLAFAAKHGPRRGARHRGLPARGAPRPVRAVLERALPRLRRRARRRRHAEDRATASEYSCALCAAGYEPTLDEMVEVTFTVSPRVRRIAAHDPARAAALRNISARSSGAPASTCRDDFDRAASTRSTLEVDRAAARREGDPVAAAAGRVRDRLRSGDAHRRSSSTSRASRRASGRASPMVFDKDAPPTETIGAAPRPAAPDAREPHRHARAAGGLDRRRRRCTTCSAGAGRS